MQGASEVTRAYARGANGGENRRYASGHVGD